jgi:hypothetical protein
MYKHAPNANVVPQVFLDNEHLGGFEELFAKLSVHFDCTSTQSLDVQDASAEFAKSFDAVIPDDEKFKLSTQQHDDDKTWSQILHVFDLGKNAASKYHVAVLMGGAAFVNIAVALGPALLKGGPGLDSSAKLVDSSSKLLQSTGRLLTSPAMMDGYAKLLSLR